MLTVNRMLVLGWVLMSTLAVSSCGESSGQGLGNSTPTTPTPPVVPTGANVVPVIVDAGPLPSTNPTANTLYTTVTVCVPDSTTQCQTIDHIQVDTGSYGLRILSSVLTAALPAATLTPGNLALAECTVFVDGYSWGIVATADIQVSGETAGNVPVQIIGDNTYPPPAGCSGRGGTAENTVAAFGANGIIGIGVFEQDCGPTCRDVAANGFYYTCTAATATVAATCVDSAVPLANQVQNPIWLFATDNNGSIIQLPSVTAPGATSLSGSLIFGIDTQSNNASGSETVLTVQTDPSTVTGQFPGNLTMAFNSGAALLNSFIDSGSNGIFFNDGNLTQCPTPTLSTDPNFSGFYCPATSPPQYTVTLTGINNDSATATFNVDSAQTLGTQNPTFTVFPTLAGPISSTDSFDFGLPFYFGRRVATAIEHHPATLVGPGPYVAF